MAFLTGIGASGEVVVINEPLLWAGAAVIGGSALWDIGTVGNHVRERKARLLQEASIEPVLLEGKGGEPVPGLAVRVRW